MGSVAYITFIAEGPVAVSGVQGCCLVRHTLAMTVSLAVHVESYLASNSVRHALHIRVPK